MMKTFFLLPTIFLLFSLDGMARFNDPVTAADCIHSDPAPGIGSSQKLKEFLHSPFLYPPAGYRIRRVVLDAGHGGKDPGCSGTNSIEKHLALKIALKAGALIEEYYPNVEVIYTRKTDVFIPLHERADIANRNNADLFISIHCNSISNAAFIRGSETYVMGLHTAERNLEVAKRENEVIYLEEDYKKNYGVDPNSFEGHILLSTYQNVHLEQSILFAEKVENHVKHNTAHHSRGVKQAGFFVLRETTMPSVLFETGYLTNATDQSYLLNTKGQDELAEALLAAFRDYKSLVESGEQVAYVEKSSVGSGEVLPNGEIALTPLKKVPEKKPHTVQTVAATSAQPEATAIPVLEIPAKAENVVTSPALQFRVQLAASRTRLDLGTTKWQNIGYLVEVVEEEGYYKYQARNFLTFSTAARAQRDLRHKGFADAFIVAYQNGKKISVAEARKISGELD